jgi:hypothetical protein
VTEVNPTEREQRWTLLVAAIVILLAAVGGFIIFANLPQLLLTEPYIAMVLLVAGFVSVTLLLYLGTIIMRTARLGTPGEALGMPEGSIRALIAMSLVLIFAIIGLTVLFTGLGGETIVSKGLSAADIDLLENVQVLGMTLVQPAASPNPALFDVTVRPELSQAGHDFGLQLMSTVSTLVVAVAGFYFGSRSVAQATKTSNEAAAAALSASRQMAQDARAAETGQTDTTLSADHPLTDDEIIGTVEDADGVDEADVEAGVADAEADAADAEATDAESADAESADAADAGGKADAEAKDGGPNATGGTPGTRT